METELPVCPTCGTRFAEWMPDPAEVIVYFHADPACPDVYGRETDRADAELVRLGTLADYYIVLNDGRLIIGGGRQDGRL